MSKNHIAVLLSLVLVGASACSSSTSTDALDATGAGAETADGGTATAAEASDDNTEDPDRSADTGETATGRDPENSDGKDPETTDGKDPEATDGRDPGTLDGEGKDPEDVACYEACQHVTGCVVDGCPQSREVASIPEIQESCIRSCQGAPEEAALAMSASCEVVIENVTADRPALAEACALSEGCPPVEDCREYARAVTECVLADCANPEAAKYADGLSRVLVGGCRESEEASENGEGCPSRLEIAFLSDQANAGCDSALFEDPDFSAGIDMLAGPICEDPEALSLEEVQRACQAVQGCTTDEPAFRDMDECGLILNLDAENRARAACVNDVGLEVDPAGSVKQLPFFQCLPVFGCFPDED